MKCLRMCFSLMLFIPLAVPFLRAQEDHRPPGPGGERIEQFKKIRLMDALKMDEETSIRFFARYNKHIAAMRDIGRSRNERVDQLQKLTQSDAHAEDIDSIIHDITALDGRTAEEQLRFLTELRDVLTVKQLGLYIVFERNFNQNLRELMRKVARERWQHREEE